MLAATGQHLRYREGGPMKINVEVLPAAVPGSSDEIEPLYRSAVVVVVEGFEAFNATFSFQVAEPGRCQIQAKSAAAEIVKRIEAIDARLRGMA